MVSCDLLWMKIKMSPESQEIEIRFKSRGITTFCVYSLKERSKVGEIFNFVLGAESSDLKIYSAELAFNLDAQFSRIKRMKSDDGSNEFRINDIVRDKRMYLSMCERLGLDLHTGNGFVTPQIIRIIRDQEKQNLSDYLNHISRSYQLHFEYEKNKEELNESKEQLNDLSEDLTEAKLYKKFMDDRLENILLLEYRLKQLQFKTNNQRIEDLFSAMQIKSLQMNDDKTLKLLLWKRKTRMKMYKFRKFSIENEPVQQKKRLDIDINVLKRAWSMPIHRKPNASVIKEYNTLRNTFEKRLLQLQYERARRPKVTSADIQLQKNKIKCLQMEIVEKELALNNAKLQQEEIIIKQIELKQIMRRKQIQRFADQDEQPRSTIEKLRGRKPEETQKYLFGRLIDFCKPTSDQMNDVVSLIFHAYQDVLFVLNNTVAEIVKKLLTDLQCDDFRFIVSLEECHAILNLSQYTGIPNLPQNAKLIQMLKLNNKNRQLRNIVAGLFDKVVLCETKNDAATITRRLPEIEVISMEDYAYSSRNIDSSNTDHMSEDEGGDSALCIERLKQCFNKHTVDENVKKLENDLRILKNEADDALRLLHEMKNIKKEIHCEEMSLQQNVFGDFCRGHKVQNIDEFRQRLYPIYQERNILKQELDIEVMKIKRNKKLITSSKYKQLIAEKKKRTLLNINSQIFQLREDFKQINFGLQKEQSALEELYSRQYKIKFKKLLLSERYQALGKNARDLGTLPKHMQLVAENDLMQCQDAYFRMLENHNAESSPSSKSLLDLIDFMDIEYNKMSTAVEESSHVYKRNKEKWLETFQENIDGINSSFNDVFKFIIGKPDDEITYLIVINNQEPYLELKLRSINRSTKQQSDQFYEEKVAAVALNLSVVKVKKWTPILVDLSAMNLHVRHAKRVVQYIVDLISESERGTQVVLIVDDFCISGQGDMYWIWFDPANGLKFIQYQTADPNKNFEQ